MHLNLVGKIFPNFFQKNFVLNKKEFVSLPSQTGKTRMV